MNAGGTGVRQLTHSAPGFGIPQWSLDDTRILFSQPSGESRDIYVMNADGGDLLRLTNGTN